ncbi:hypothetical protein ACIBQX_21800 [Nonomuraea sp. NPDC049714]|uniref:hypothetical protein n=1 Tax=Nonomuraea sp. NPDC049714 TaxID=3364357 RepID=UPI0037BA0432
MAKKQDVGDFKYYAGPVKVRAKGPCVAFHGSIADKRANLLPSPFGARAVVARGHGGYGDCSGEAGRRRASR